MIKSFEVLILQHFCFILGGVETLYFRMMKWAHSQGIKTVLILDGNSFIESSWREKFKEIDVSLYYVYGVYPFYNFKDESGATLDLSKYKEVLYISEYYGGYIKGEYLKSKFKFSNFVNLFYVLTPYDMMKSRIQVVRFLENKLLRHIIRSNSILFMDEQTRQTAKNAHVELLNSNHKIVRLGYEIDTEVSEQFLKEKYKNINRYLCSVTRFDFPFKKYILSLIDIFAALSVEYPTLKLIIIGKGPGRGEVINRIDELDKNISNRITLLDGVSYDELRTYIDCSFINIGMGTTILDFANRSVPSIISLASEEGNVSYNLWSENWHILGGFLKDNLAPLVPMKKCIENALKLSEEEYVRLCKSHRMILVNHYSMDHAMEQIYTHDVCNEFSINPFFLHLYSIVLYFRTGIERLFPQLLKLLERSKEC